MTRKMTEKKFKCHHCEKTFTRPDNRQTHEKLKHKVVKTFKSTFPCDLCQVSFTSKKSLIEHIKQTHSDLEGTQIIEFGCIDDFMKWKEELEKDTFSSFIVNKTYTTCSCIVKLYICHRGGNFKSKSKGIRRIKWGGSNKIGAVCPANIRVEINKLTGRLKIIYFPTHMGHNNEIWRLRMPKSEKQKIIGCEFSGVPIPPSVHRRIKKRVLVKSENPIYKQTKKGDVYFLKNENEEISNESQPLVVCKNEPQDQFPQISISEAIVVNVGTDLQPVSEAHRVLLNKDFKFQSGLHLMATISETLELHPENIIQVSQDIESCQNVSENVEIETELNETETIESDSCQLNLKEEAKGLLMGLWNSVEDYNMEQIYELINALKEAKYRCESGCLQSLCPAPVLQQTPQSCLDVIQNIGANETVESHFETRTVVQIDVPSTDHSYL